MTYQVFTAMTDNAEMVMTYLLRLLNGQEYLLVADSPDRVMSIDEDGDTWTGKLFEGGTIEVLDQQFMSVEPDRYRVEKFNGQTTRIETVSEKQLERILDNATNPRTGEVGGNIKAIGEVGNDENRVTTRRDERFL